MRLSIIAVLVVALSLLAPAATAQTRTKSDPRGDAPAAIDLVKLSASNTTSRIRIRVNVRDLTRAGWFALGFSTNKAAGEDISVRLQWRKGHLTTKTEHCGPGFCDPVKCPGVKRTWNARENFISVTIPDSCYRGDRTRSIGASSLGSGDDFDSVYFDRVKVG